MQIRIKIKLFIVILYFLAGFFPIAPLKSNENELSEILKPLGLYRRRAKTLIKFSWMWVKGFTDVMELHGIGQYAKDSWEIFQMDNMDVNPTDKVLSAYLYMERKNAT